MRVESESKKRRYKKVYLDVETYRPQVHQDFIGEHIILISILIDESDKPKFFESFEIEKERDSLKEFYMWFKDLIGDAIDSSESTKPSVDLIGYNILRFDIPLLTAKAIKYNIVSEVFGINKDIHEAEYLSKFWHNIYTIDLMQILLPLNKMVFKGLSLRNALIKLGEIATECELGDYPVESGEVIKELYENRNYDEIKQKSLNDLKATRALYKCIKDISFSETRKKLF